MSRLLYRNISAHDNLELFLVSAASSLLLLRYVLFKAGYPQFGGGLHIAHMLYGGLLMMAAVVILLSFIGGRARRLAAFMGGVGFGIFIDELGKFITKDNNYFFRPTIGLIYSIFAILFLTFNFIGRRQTYSSQEYQLNALQNLDEAITRDMDAHEKTAIRQLLTKADQSSVITKQLLVLVNHTKPVDASESRFQRAREVVGRAYDRFWQQKISNKLVSSLFVIESIIFLVIVMANLVNGFDSVNDLIRRTDHYSTILLIGQLLASVLAAIFTVIGAVKLISSRLEAFEYFRRAVMVNLLLTEFFIFSRIQFHAIPGFLVNLVLFIALRAAISQEHHAGGGVRFLATRSSSLKPKT